MTLQVRTAVLLTVPFFWNVTLSVVHTTEEPVSVKIAVFEVVDSMNMN